MLILDFLIVPIPKSLNVGCSKIQKYEIVMGFGALNKIHGLFL